MEVIKIPKKTVTMIEPKSSVDGFSKFNKKRVAAYEKEFGPIPTETKE